MTLASMPAFRLHASIAAAILCATFAWAAPEPPTTNRPGEEALAYAFDFASAIVTDPKDMGQAQEGVVLDYAAIGSWDEAERKAELVEGWRKGTATADIATGLASAGRIPEARRVLAAAKEMRKTITGWEGHRVDAHIAQAHAALGDVAESTRMGAQLAADDAQQYAGQAVATSASGHATAGEYEQAMHQLGTLDKEKDFDVAWWRTVGYVGVARQESLPESKRREAVKEARRSADGIAGWKKAEALQSVAELMRGLGDRGGAKEALEAAEKVLLATAETMPMRSPLLSNIARSWARQGETKRAREMLQRSLASVPSTLDIDRPAIYANIAASYLALEDDAEARKVYDLSFASAESLINARPRALAVVAICRSMGRSLMPLDNDVRSRLDALRRNLKDPW